MSSTTTKLIVASAVAAAVASAGAPPEGAVGPNAPMLKSISKPVQDVLKERRYEMKACHAEQLKKNPYLGGTVTLRLRISTAGTVATADIAQSTTGGPELGVCMVAKALKWQFPPSKEEQVVTYPYAFEGAAPPPDAGVVTGR